MINDSNICQRCSKIMMYDSDGRYYCDCDDDDDLYGYNFDDEQPPICEVCNSMLFFLYEGFVCPICDFENSSDGTRNFHPRDRGLNTDQPKQPHESCEPISTTHD